MIYEKLHHDINAIKCSPNINEAIYHHIHNQIEFFEKNKFLSKFMSEYKKYVISIKTASLLTEKSSSFTKKQLQNFTSEKKLATPNRTSAIIDTAIHLGFLTSKQAVEDRRHNALFPTEKFHRNKNEQIFNYEKTLNLIFSNIEVSQSANAFSLPEKYLEIYFSTSLLYKQKSEIHVFLKRDAGYPILLKILQATYQSHQQKPFISLPFSNLSRSFGVSRAHVQKMFQAAHEAQLIRLQTTGGKEIEVLPLLKRLSRNMIILSLAITKSAIDHAQAQTTGREAIAATEVPLLPLTSPTSANASFQI